MSNRRRPSDADTRNAATALKAWFGTSRDVEARAKSRGLAVSHATFARIESAPWYDPRPQNKPVIEMFARAFADELALDSGRDAATESDLLDIHEWIQLNGMDACLLAPTPALWQQDAKLARAILARSKTDTLSSRLVRSSAMLHLSRNPNLEAHERASARTSAIELIEDTIEMHAPLYAATKFDEILAAERNDLISLVATDPIGLVISTMLHLLNQAYAARSDEAWRQNMANLLKRGLVPQMAVRGLFFNEPETVINTAELLFENGDEHTARRLMIRAKEMDMNLLERIEKLWANRLEPGFMALVRATLAPHTAKVLLVAVTAMAAMFGIAPDVAFASKPIIVSGML